MRCNGLAGSASDSEAESDWATESSSFVGLESCQGGGERKESAAMKTTESPSFVGLESFHDGDERKESAAMKIVSNNVFQSLVIGVILLNTLVLAAEADFPDWPPWRTVDSALLLFFVSEIALRLCAFGPRFFCNEECGWNNFDFWIVFLGVLDQWIIHGIFASRQNSRGGMSKFIMIMRVARVLRVLRAIRLFKEFKELYILCLGFRASIASVGYIAMLLLAFISVCSIFVTRVVGHSPDKFEDPEQIKLWFGSMLHSMETLYIFLSCDDWSTPARMVNDVMPVMELFWIFYLYIGCYAILSLLTGLMAERMLSVREENETTDKEILDVQVLALILELRAEFEQLDRDHNESLTEEEFLFIVQDPKHRDRIGKLGLKIHPREALAIFRHLDVDRSGSITWDQFRNGLMKIGDSTNAKDVLYLRGKTLKVDHAIQAARKQQEARGGLDKSQADAQIARMRSKAQEIQERTQAMEMELKHFFTSQGFVPPVYG